MTASWWTCFRMSETRLAKALKWAMSDVSEELEERFNYKPVLPLAIEMEAGKNWMDKALVNVD